MTIWQAEVRERRYTVSIAKGAAAISEIRRLLQCWTPGEDYSAFMKRVQQSGVLGKQTDRRARDMVKEVFRPRLLTPDDRAARTLKQFLEAGGEGQTFKELLFLYQARAEDLLYDFTVMRFWPACRSGALLMTLDDVLAFFDEAVQTGRLPSPWSRQVQIKVARGVLAALREFGFLRQETRGRREIVPYRITDAGVACLAHELHFRGLPDAAVVEHPDWGLFGLDRATVLDRLDALGPPAGLLVQRAGSVVRITWSHPAMEALTHALTQ
jgi:hypothetical protein